MTYECRCGLSDCVYCLGQRIRELEAALLAWYEESGRGTKQSIWPANLWALARAIGERPTLEREAK